MKQLKDFDNYFIDDTGRVWSNQVHNRNLLGEMRVLTPVKDKDGYPYVTIRKDKLSYTKRIHRLVAEAYIDNPNNFPCVCHRDDNPANCNVNNLFWGTHQMNTDDMVRKGRNKKAKGMEVGSSKLTEEQIRFIRGHEKSMGYQHQLSVMFNVAYSTISNIINRVTWKHI